MTWGIQVARLTIAVAFVGALGLAAGANWIVSEINLNQLLADYASRVAGGDIYYTPLVKNPGGGDTLALYFEFDERSVIKRTLEVYRELIPGI